MPSTEATPSVYGQAATTISQGAEARVYALEDFLGRPAIVKERFAKAYRHPVLDRKLNSQRLASEVRCIAKCRGAGVDVPCVYFVDTVGLKIVMERVQGVTVKEFLWSTERSGGGGVARSSAGLVSESSIAAAEASAAAKATTHEEARSAVSRAMGRSIAVLHSKGLVHGDLTTSNMMLRELKIERADLGGPRGGERSQGATGEEAEERRAIVHPDGRRHYAERVVLIDFGLGGGNASVDDKAVDLYVLERAMLSTHPNSQPLFDEVTAAYLKQSEIIEERETEAEVAAAVAKAGGGKKGLSGKRRQGQGAPDVIRALERVRARGRKRVAFG